MKIINNVATRKAVALAFFLLGTTSLGTAAPALWETDFGSPLSSLTGEDSAIEAVTMSFQFPFGGGNYSTVYVSTNGYLNFGSDADYPYADPIVSDLLDSAAPLIAPFFSDLDLVSRGAVYFNDLGDRAVFTWDGVGSWSQPGQAFTFQTVLKRNGSIVLSYNGIPDIAVNLDTNLLVGVGPGNGAPNPGGTDLSTAGSLPTGYTVYQMFEQGVEQFDLDNKSLLLSPTASGYVATVVPEPSSMLMLAGGLAALAVIARKRLRP